jgi:enamine deaminase RidA (YjgF/YER057c/UK114 family)
MPATQLHAPQRINPTSWNTGFRYDQAQLRPAPTQLLTVAGQGSLDADGALLHEGDLTAQMALAMANLEDLLARGGMDLRDVTRLVVYVTDMDAALAAYGAITERLDAVGATPPATLLQVARLALPGMAVEIDATAGR